MPKMLRRRKKEREVKMSVYEVNFEILNSRADGIGVFKYTVQNKDYDEKREQAAYRLISAWIDPNKTSVIRAHLGFDRRIPSQHRFYGLLSTEGRVTDRRDYHTHITCDANQIIRYGRDSDHPYEQSTLSDDGRGMYTIYDSKGKALLDLLQQIDRNIPIIGLRLISLAAIPDEMLLEIGYQRIPDEFRRGADMWLGHPDWVLRSSSGSDRYGYGGVTSVYKKNCQSVLDILAKYWGVVKHG